MFKTIKVHDEGMQSDEQYALVRLVLDDVTLFATEQTDKLKRLVKDQSNSKNG